MSKLEGTLLLLGWLSLAAFIDMKAHANYDADKVCREKPTAAKHDQCRNITSFAMSAGW